MPLKSVASPSVRETSPDAFITDFPFLNPELYKAGLETATNELADFRVLHENGFTGQGTVVTVMEDYDPWHTGPIEAIKETLAPGAEHTHWDWHDTQLKEWAHDNYKYKDGGLSPGYWGNELKRHAEQLQKVIESSDPSKPLIITSSQGGASEDFLTRNLLDTVYPYGESEQRRFDPATAELFSKVFYNDELINNNDTNAYKVAKMDDIYNRYTSEERKELFDEYSRSIINDPEFKEGQYALYDVMAKAAQEKPNVLFVQAEGNPSRMNTFPIDLPELPNVISVGSAADINDKFYNDSGHEVTVAESELFYPHDGRFSLTGDSVDVMGFDGSEEYAGMDADGTSFTAPMAASAAALVFQANPTLTAEKSKALLQLTAFDDPNISFEREGAGRLNPLGAVNAARLMYNDGLSLEEAAQVAKTWDENHQIATLPLGAILPAA